MRSGGVRFKWSYAFYALVLILGAYVISDLRSTQSTGGKGDLIPVFESKAEDVSEIKFLQQKILLKRIDGVWTLLEPVQDVAEEVAVQALMMQLFGNSGKEVFADSESGKSVSFEPPRLALTLNGQKSETVLFSEQNAFDGKYFVKRQDGKILVVDTSWSRVFEMTPSSLRSRKILPKPERVERIEVSGPQKFSLIAGAGAWQMEPDPGFLIDSTKVDHWLDEIQGLRANEFAFENPSLEDLKSIGLLPPLMTIAIKMAKGTSWQIGIGRPIADDTYTQTNLRPTVYKLKSNILNKVAVTKDFFRDGKRFFNFDLEKVTEVRINLNGVQTSLKRADLNWTYETANGTLDSLGADRLSGFFQRLHALEAVDFVEKGGPQFPKTSTIQVIGPEQQTLLEFFVGPAYTGTNGFAKGMSLNYVKVAGQTTLLGLKSSELIELVTPALLAR